MTSIQYKLNEISLVIKSTSSSDSLNDLEIIEKTIHCMHCSKKYSDASTQTEISNINMENLSNELTALRIKNSNLEKDLSTVSNLLKQYASINKDNPQVDEIKTKLALIVNREIRQHHVFPFISIFRKS
jgi:hypothetical protein